MNRNAYDIAILASNSRSERGLYNAWRDAFDALVSEGYGNEIRFNPALKLIYYTWLDIVRYGRNEGGVVLDVCDSYDFSDWKFAYLICERESLHYSLNADGWAVAK